MSSDDYSQDPSIQTLIGVYKKLVFTSDFELLFNNILPSKKRPDNLDIQPFFEMVMEERNASKPKYFRAPVTVSESLLLADFMEQYQASQSK